MEKVLGLGNALVDIVIKLDDERLLENFSLPKGSMQLVNYKMVEKILVSTRDLKKYKASGGSVANTIHGLANLGVKTGYIGKICDDDIGRFFRGAMQKNNIELKLLYSTNPTGRAITLITPDSERTFATYLGSAAELSDDDISDELFEGYKYFYLEGYLVQNHNLIQKAVQLAKNNNLKVILDLSSYNIVRDNLEFLKSIVKNYIDILFANEEEAKCFTGKSPAEALDIIAEICELAIVKNGKEGSLIKRGIETYKINSIPANCIDTTGAGDLYAAGFIFGMVNNLSLRKCGEIGSFIGGKVTEVIGSKLPNTSWQEIKRYIKQLS